MIFKFSRFFTIPQYFQSVLGSVQTVNDMMTETKISEEHSWKLQILAKNYALLKLIFVGVGFIFFLVTFCIGRDRARVEAVVPGKQNNHLIVAPYSSLHIYFRYDSILCYIA